jgi:hypothetical protein
MQRRRASFRRLKMGTCQLREKTLTEKHRSSRITGGWRRDDNATEKNDLCRNPKKKKKKRPGSSQDCGAKDDDTQNVNVRRDQRSCTTPGRPSYDQLILL